MRMEPLYLKLGTPSGGEVLARLREGRRRALASIETRFIVSFQDGGRIREVVFNRQPTAQNILAKLGENAIVVGVDIQRAPTRIRPQVFE